MAAAGEVRRTRSPDEDAGVRAASVVDVRLAHGTAVAVAVRSDDALGVALRDLGLAEPRPTLVVVGGASGLATREGERLRPLFQQALLPTVAEVGGAIVDGGTESGVMSLVGEAAAAAAGPGVPLIGVAAIGTVSVPGFADAVGSAHLEPNHTHFVLVPGHEWGDESEWLSRVAAVLAGPRPSATVLVNGGETAWRDVEASVTEGRPVLVLRGSGRAADDMASQLGAGATAGDRADRLLVSGLVEAVDLDAGLSHVANALRARLGGA